MLEDPLLDVDEALQGGLVGLELLPDVAQGLGELLQAQTHHLGHELERVADADAQLARDGAADAPGHAGARRELDDARAVV